MSTDAIRSRFGGLGTYAGTAPEDAGSLRRAPDFQGPVPTQSAQLRMSAGLGAGRLSLAQGVQLGVAVAQAGLAASQMFGAAPAGRDQEAAPAPGESGSASGAAGARRQLPGMLAGLADTLAMAPEPADAPQASGSDLQAWLDIATGRAALQAAEAMRGRAQAAPQEPSPEPEGAPRTPEEPAAPDREPAARQVAAPWAEEADAPEPMPTQAAAAPVRPQAPAESPLRAALEQAGRSFGAALERLDAQLEPALAAAVARLGGADPSEVAASSASRMRQEPARAVAGHTGGSGLPGILGLLRWDLTPLSEPLPDAAPGRG